MARATVEMMDKADDYGDMGLQLLKQGKYEEGLKFLGAATKANPYDAKWHLHYANTLRHKGMASLKAGNRIVGRRIFKEVEKQFLMATKIFMDYGDTANAASTYYQIAEINRHVYQRPRIAIGYYQKVLELNPGHQGAKSAVGK
jgi:tetratricopeptide (TPR) repeat protein